MYEGPSPGPLLSPSFGPLLLLLLGPGWALAFRSGVGPLQCLPLQHKDIYIYNYV